MGDRGHHVGFTNDDVGNRDEYSSNRHRNQIRNSNSPARSKGDNSGSPRRREKSRGRNSPGVNWDDSAVDNTHKHQYQKHHEEEHGHVPTHIYDRYPNEMDGSPSERSRSGDHPVDIPPDANMQTVYIPKNDGGKTLMRRRRNSSKRRSSSRRKHEREEMEELMNTEDNHLLPSLRYTRKHRTKSLKERRSDLEEEKRLDEIGGAETFGQRFHDLKDSHEMNAGNFAELLRTSTLRKVKKIADWNEPKRMERFRRWRREHFSRLSPWVTSFKVVEGKFGTAVMSFFRFIRWLFFLNLFLMVVMLGVTVIPYLAFGSQSFNDTVAQNRTRYYSLAVNCTEEYIQYSKEIFNQETTFEKVLDFLQGTGWMERTVLFYGRYQNLTKTNSEGETYTFNMSLAYILSIGACFFVSAILLIRNSAITLKTTFGMEQKVAAYTNRVYAGWDYAICNKKAAKIKSQNIYHEYKSCLKEEVEKLRREKRSPNDRATVYLIRIMVNCCVLALLAGALFLVYYLTDYLLGFQEKDLNVIVTLIVQYLPYLAITVLNFAIPIVFQKIVILEDYSPNFALNITLTRSVLLRQASLLVLFFTLYRLLISDNDDDEDDGLCGNRLWDKTGQTSKGSIKCWETYVGQQIYKLVLLDLIVETSIVFFVQLPRRLIYNKFNEKSKVIRKIGPQEFDLPQSVIDIIYSQTLCWMGMFFSPLIPLMTFVKCFLFFYLRKWTLLRNCVQTGNTYRTSRSHSLFMFVLLISFVIALLTVGYMVSSLAPSQSCGPFRVYSSTNYTIFSSVTNEVQTWPDTIRDIILFLSSVAFLVTGIIVIGLVMYVFCLLGQGYKKREKILSEQLRMVSKDKQFLLTRVNEVLT